MDTNRARTLSDFTYPEEKVMSDLSKRLREICDRHDAIGNMPLISTSELLYYADLMDQQEAEIAELSEIVEAQKQEILDLHDIRDQRDEWQRRAWWLWDRLIITLDDENDVAAEVYPEAAQWFED